MKKFKYLKKALAILLIVLILASTLRFVIFKPKEVQAADMLLGFNEGYGTSTNDNNTAVSALTITGATWKTEDLCKTGKCLFYDGTQDYVSIADASTGGNLDFVASDSFTIEGWFRTPDTSAQRTLIAKYNSTAAGYKVYMDANGFLVFGADYDTTWTPTDSASTSTTAFDDNKWHFFSAVKTGTTSMTIYVDGIQYQTDSSITNSTLANADSFYIGIDGDGTSNDYTGFIDEVKVYRSARTAAEIKADYLGETPSRGVTASFGPDQSYLTNGLVGYWKMEEAGDATRIDSSGNGNTLTESASDTVAQATGKFGYAGDFESTETEDLSIADNSSLSVTGSLTLSAWIKPESVSAGTYNILAKWDGSNESYRIYQSTNQIVFEVESSNSITSTTTLSAATWYHISGVYDASNQTAKIYINGTLETPSASAGTIPSSIGDDGGAFQMGAEDLNNTPKNYYDGIIDEVRVYNRALSPAEVAKLYSFAPGPVGHWKMDENTLTTAQDSSGLDNAGTLTNTPTWTTGKFGSAVSFAGSDQHITRADDSDFDFGTAASFSYGAWIKHGTASALEMIIDKYDATAGNGGFKLYMESDGDLTCGIDDDETSFPEAAATSTLATYDDNLWHHINCVKDGTSTLNLYIDGVLITSTSISGVTGDFANADPLYIGIAEDGTSNDWVGQIDNVLIYNYARTPSQIIEDMNAGHPAPGSPIGSAVAYWKFDEGYSTTAYDDSVNANNLTLSTASWTNSGKFGKAFNGLTNVRLSRTTDPDLEFSATDDFTLSLWYKSDSANNPAAIEYLVNDGAAAGSAGYAVYANTDGTICFGIDDDASWGPDVASCTTTDIYDNTWHHITAVRNVVLDTTKIYIDAVEKDSDTDTTTATLDSSPTFYIGDANATDGTDEFLGDIDEVKVFRSALTADAIKVLYNQSSGQSLGSLSTNWNGSTDVPSNADIDSYCPRGQGSACTAPILHYKMDENTGTTSTNDSSTNGYIGTFVGSMTVNDWVQGKYGGALDFDGTDDSVQNTSVSLPTGDFTYSIWIYPTAFATSNAFIGLPQASVGGNEFMIDTDSGGDIDVVMDNGVLLINGTDGLISLNNWYHIAVTRIGSTVTTYINGNIDQTASEADALSLAACGIRVGRSQSSTSCSSAGSNIFQGRLDDLRVYNYGRTAAQVSWDMNQGKPIGWWKLDENTGTAANDSMGNSTAGTLTNSPTWATGKLNSGVTFAGSNQHVLIGDDPNFDFGDDENMTLTTWFKHTTASAQEVILSKYAAAGYKIIMESDGNITCGLDYDSTWTPTDSATSTAATYDDNTWHHIACVKTGATSLDLYIDGVLIATDSSLTATNTLTNADPLYLGIDADGTSNDFTGSLDDVRIYRYPLTIQQIKTVINNGSAVKF